MASCCPKKKDGFSASSCGVEEVHDVASKPTFSVIGKDVAACCGERLSRPCLSVETPGFRLWGFVNDFMETPAGPVPRVRLRLTCADHGGTVCARLGIGRNDYRIAPGLYATGLPDAQSPVMVTANYKLSFDKLRLNLVGVDAWIVVVDTHGINVWCASAKGTFSADEVAGRVNATGIGKIVAHRRLILPQLSATGVEARRVKTMCGFKVVWGPVHARHIKGFLDNGMQADPAMRQATFTLRERVELIPVELTHLVKPTGYLLPVLFLLSGVGPGFFSIEAAVSRGMWVLLAYLLAVAAGTVLVPILLAWLPGRAFALKGAGIGVVAGALLSAGLAQRLAKIEMLALTLFIMALSSYLAMNFTGSTPFTSPTGVEKEMRRAIPVQAAGSLAAVVLWVIAGFMGV